MSKYTAEQVTKYHKYLVSINAASELIDYIRDYAALLLERELAKAGVSDDDICDAMTVMFGNHWKPHTDEYSRMRAVLEAFAPMLASARVPDGWMDSIRYAVEVLESEAEIRDNDDAGNRTMKRHIRALKAMLAAAPKRGEG